MDASGVPPPTPQEPKLPSLRENAGLLVGQGQPKEVIIAQTVWESCPAKSIISGVMGFALGGVFGLIGGSFDPVENTNLRARDVLRDMGKRSYSMGKNFAIVGGIFAGTECAVETYRGKTDTMNGLISGCVTGAAFGFRAGGKAALGGCAGFAAFTAVIDTFVMHR
eukprot:comp4648_c0_seq1/m.836 comp4648_c0_seq1/g.836  ORF comp4648_c0_seq1/g.836 comp4648_c0_seq1/m.836 type:complete len:166 (-) comp4648_c0_seq1:323-820(-)